MVPRQRIKSLINEYGYTLEDIEEDEYRIVGYSTEKYGENNDSMCTVTYNKIGKRQYIVEERGEPIEEIYV